MQRLMLWAIRPAWHLSPRRREARVIELDLQFFKLIFQVAFNYCQW
jgi:hypothetical protein